MKVSMRLFPPEELIKCDMLDDPVSAILEGTCFWALADDGTASVETLPDGCAPRPGVGYLLRRGTMCELVHRR